MAKSRIQGITITLDAETKGIEEALKDVNKRSRDLQGELREVDKLLKFNPDSVELINQKQELLAKSIENTTEKLNRLRKAQDQVEQQFKSGDIGEEQYRAFRREIEKTESQLKNLDNRLSQVDASRVKEVKTSFDRLKDSINESTEQVKDLDGSLGNLVAGAGAIVGLGEIFQKALDTSELNTQIDLSFNLDDEAKDVAKDLIKDFEAYGIEASESLQAIQKQFNLNEDATEGYNASVIKRAGALQKAYSNLDLNEIIQESYEISKIFGIGQQEAIGLIQAMADIGFDTNQLDIIAEYGTQMERMGFSIEDAGRIFATATKLGVQNIDQIGDSVGEGRKVMSGFGYEVDDAMATLLSQVGISTTKFQNLGKAIAEGGEGGRVAMSEVATMLQGIEDKTLRNQLGVKIFGTLYEEAGDNITATIQGMTDNMLTIDEGLQRNNENLEALDRDPFVKLKTAMNDLVVQFEPLFDRIAEMVGSFADWVSANPELVANIVEFVVVLGGILGIMAGLVPIVSGIITLFSSMGAIIGFLSTPVGWVVLAIGGLIAIGYLLWRHWDVIKAKAIEIWGAIKEWFSETCENIKEFFINAWENIKTTTVNVWEAIKSFFAETVPQIVENVVTWFGELPDKIAFAFGVLLGHIIQWGIDTWNYFTTNVPIWIESIVNWFGELPVKIWNWLVGVYNNIVEWGSNVWSYLKTNVPVWINNVVSFFSELPGKIWTWLLDTINKVAEFGRDLGIKAKECGSTFVSGVVDTVTSLPEKMVNIGKNIVRGLWEGITGMWDWLWDRVSGFFNNIVSGVMSVLDEHSPSRVFMKIGEYTGEGFAIGMENTTRMVSKAGEQMANASIPKIPKFNKSISEINSQPTTIYLTTENYMDSKLIGSHTTKNVINNMNRSSRNYKIGKGGLGYV